MCGARQIWTLPLLSHRVKIHLRRWRSCWERGTPGGHLSFLLPHLWLRGGCSGWDLG